MQINISRQIQKKVGELKDTQVDREEAEIFTLNTLTKTRENVKINRKYFRTQEDTGYDITIIPVNFWQDLEKQRLKKSTLLLKQFDGTIETKNHFKIMPITVVVCTKDHELLGRDVLKVDTSKLVNSMELEKQEIGLLKGYEASIRHPRYLQARR